VLENDRRETCPTFRKVPLILGTGSEFHAEKSMHRYWREDNDSMLTTSRQLEHVHIGVGQALKSLGLSRFLLHKIKLSIACPHAVVVLSQCAGYTHDWHYG